MLGPQPPDEGLERRVASQARQVLVGRRAPAVVKARVADGGAERREGRGFVPEGRVGARGVVEGGCLFSVRQGRGLVPVFFFKVSFFFVFVLFFG